MIRTFAIAAAALALTAPARAEEPRPVCAAVSDAGLPPALAGAWTHRSPAAAAATDAGQTILPLGKAVDAQLKPNGEVAFPAPPGRPGGAGTYGGLYELRIAEPGDYQVSLGAGVWIEVARDGAVLEPTSHAPGVACTSLKKAVVFTLQAGRHVLEITGATQPTLPLLVTRVSR